MAARILYLAPEISLQGGHGGSSHVLGAVRGFAVLGHSIVAVVQWSLGEPFVRHEGRVLWVALPVLPTGALRNMCYWFWSMVMTLGGILFFHATVVYERGRIFGGWGVLLARLFRAAGVRSVYELNEPVGQLLLERIRRGLFWKWIGALVCWMDAAVQRAASLVTVTHETMKTVHGARYHVMSYGVDVQRFNPRVSGIAIRKQRGLRGAAVVYVGSFAPWHSLQSLLSAALLLEKRKRAVTFLLVGDGRQRKALERFCAAEGISSVVFTGRLSSAEMPRVIAAADICIALFDRRYGAFKRHSFFYSPIKIHEYQAMGKPIIASDFGGLNALVPDRKAGLLVDERRPSAIADAVERLLDDSHLVATIRRFNLHVAASHRWELLCQHVLDRLL